MCSHGVQQRGRGFPLLGLCLCSHDGWGFLHVPLVQDILGKLEDEARVQASKPKPMKSFSESRKADRSLVTGKGASAALPAKEATPPVEEVGGKDQNGTKESPRNMGILKKLGTRERGGGKGEKKPSKSK